MNTATEILLMADPARRVPGGETDVRPRGGIFGPQGYGGGVFDGMGATDQESPTLALQACRTDCMTSHPPGSPGLAPCLESCDQQYGPGRIGSGYAYGVAAGAAAGAVAALAVAYLGKVGRLKPMNLVAGGVAGALIAAIGIGIYKSRAIA